MANKDVTENRRHPENERSCGIQISTIILATSSDIFAKFESSARLFTLSHKSDTRRELLLRRCVTFGTLMLAYC